MGSGCSRSIDSTACVVEGLVEPSAQALSNLIYTRKTADAVNHGSTLLPASSRVGVLCFDSHGVSNVSELSRITDSHYLSVPDNIRQQAPIVLYVLCELLKTVFVTSGCRSNLET